jgi:RimJ/RimL family protein N-acetyltransferase
LIGNCGVFGIELTHRSAELGIMIGDKSEWNKGYGAEAMTLLLRHCFETLNLNRAFLRVYEDNIRAVRSYEKAGFILEGRQRQAVYKNGKYEDVLFMSVLRSEWDKRMKEKH